MLLNKDIKFKLFPRGGNVQRRQDVILSDTRRDWSNQETVGFYDLAPGDVSLYLAVNPATGKAILTNMGTFSVETVRMSNIQKYDLQPGNSIVLAPLEDIIVRFMATPLFSETPVQVVLSLNNLEGAEMTVSYGFTKA